MERSRKFGLLLGILSVAFGWDAFRTEAAVMTEQYEASARLAVQNTFQHRDVKNISWVQERNEFRFDLRYDFIKPGSGGWWLFDRMRGNILYRARYDAIFDIREVYGRRGFRRDDFRFPEGEYPRELFFDIVPRGPLSMRIGRQQVVWGEADLFRSLDVINPLRLDQQGLIGDDFADYREPLWIAKFLYNVGQLGPLADTNIEFLYSPDSRPLSNQIIVSEAFRLTLADNNPRDGFRRPQALPFNRTRHPWEVSRVGPYRTDAANQADLSNGRPRCNTSDPNPLRQGCADFAYLIHDDWPKKMVSLEKSMFGVRFLGKTFAGMDFSLNYLFKRTEVPGTALSIIDLFDPTIASDGSPNARLQNPSDPVTVRATTLPWSELIHRCVDLKEPNFILTARSPNGQSIHGRTPFDTQPNGNAVSGCETVGFWYPWTHIIGGTLTYNDYNYTGFVFRLEESVSTKEPRNHKPPLAGERAGDYPHQADFNDHLKRKVLVWRSMVGFDYLRAIWSPAPKAIRDYWFSTFLKDQWFFTFQFFNEYYSSANQHIGLLDSVTDRMQQWNPVLTFLMTGFFHHELLRPTIAAGYDVNAKFPVLWLQAEYHIGKQFTVRAGDILYMGSQNAESFLFLNKYADRDTLFLRVTYWLI